MKSQELTMDVWGEFMKVRIKSNQGIAMVVVIAMMLILLSISGAALLLSGLNLKTASNLKTGAVAIHAADAGVQHGLAVIPSGTTFSYSTETTLLSSYSFGSGYTYTVTAINDSASSGGNTRAIVTSVATGPNNSKRKVKAYIGRSSTWVPPGVVYVPGQAEYIATLFNGSAFRISGQDTNPGQAMGSGSASPIPGITTTASATTTEITGASGSLSSSQYAQVTGQGSSPSVVTSSATLDVNQLANDLIAIGVEGVNKQTLASGTYSSGEWGTSTLPKITHITGDATLAGTLTGYGVLIVNGLLVTRGSFAFKGLVIGLGDVDFNGSGNVEDAATIWGTLMMEERTSGNPDEMKVAGSGKVYYSSQTLSVVTTNWGNAFPKAAKLTAWHEVLQ